MLTGMNDENDKMTYIIKIENDPTLTEHKVDFFLQDYDLNTLEFTWLVLIKCPGCPEGNFTSPELQEVYDYLAAYNYSNFSMLYADAQSSANGSSYNVSDYISINTALLDVPDLPTIDLPLNINLPSIDFLPAVWISLDLLLLIYRWYKTAGMLAQVIRGRDVEVGMKFLMVTGHDDFVLCPDGASLRDKCLSALICMTDQCSNMGMLFWKLFYFAWAFFLLGFAFLCILAMYILIDTVVSEKFIKALGIFDLMTSGLASQRITRNQVICSTAASYNNYTLTQMRYSREIYATQKNLQAYQWNLQESDRVDEWNFYFCNSWGAYMDTVRDVTVDGNTDLLITNVSYAGTGSVPGNLFDKVKNTSFVPYPDLTQAGNNDDNVTRIEFELPQMVLNPSKGNTSYWRVFYLEFDWTFYSNNTPGYSSTSDSIPFTLFRRLNTNQSWIPGEADVTKYTAASKDKIHEKQTVNVEWNETRYIALVFPNAGQWSDAFLLNEVRVFGSIPQKNIECDDVVFHYWDYDASAVAMPDCPSITPIHGIMYRGWVREWLADDLFTAHLPFINAVRNICLSPFFIAAVAIVGLACVYVAIFMIEWFLLMVDLYRENPYGKIPIVFPKNEIDEALFQDQTEKYTGATITSDFYRPEIVDDFTEFEEDAEHAAASAVMGQQDVQMTQTASMPTDLYAQADATDGAGYDQY
jgi:hypothetical protein